MKNYLKIAYLILFKKIKWQDMEYFDPKWSERIYEMSLYLKDDKSVLDLGCGKMWLKKYLRNNPYFPVDYTSRGEGTIVCDFNQHEFPDIKSDVSFVSGTLEYVVDVEWFISEVSKSSNECIISYCLTDDFPDINFRKRQAWKNNLSSSQLVDLFLKFGFELISRKQTKTKNSIFYFTKRDLAVI